MSAHTPGPWAVNPFCARVDSAVASEFGDLLPIAEMLWPTEERSEAETEANAQLIAAAPDMLEALEYLVSLGGGDCLEPARAAIAKATGQ